MPPLKRKSADRLRGRWDLEWERRAGDVMKKKKKNRKEERGRRGKDDTCAVFGLAAGEWRGSEERGTCIRRHASAARTLLTT